MPSLRELELAFVGNMFDAADLAAAGFVCANGMAPAARLAVYRNNIVHNYHEALRDVYPVVAQLVGKDFFRLAADRYIPCHASCHGDLHCFGGDFAAFLEDFPPAAGLPYLGDVARLEWCWHESFHAADCGAMALDRLTTVAEDALPSLLFELHPSCRLLASSFPVDRIWQANQSDAMASETIDLATGGAQLLICRRRNVVEIASIGAAEFALLAALTRAEPLATALHAAHILDASFDFATFLAKRVGDATLVDFSVASNVACQTVPAARPGAS